MTGHPARSARDVSLDLAQGEHALEVDYFRGTRFLFTDRAKNAANQNTLRLRWRRGPSGDMKIIPADNLTYRGALGTQQHGSGEGLLMQPFLGPNFETPLPEQNRVIREIDFDWGEFSPILSQTA